MSVSTMDDSAGVVTPDIDGQLNGVLPIFVKDFDIKNANGYSLSDYQISLHISKTIGNGRIKGLQKIRGLWRIYLKSNEAKTELVSKGISIDNKKLPLYTDNPYAANTKDPSDERIKVTVRDYRMSASTEPILKFCRDHGIEPTSPIKNGHIRTSGGFLTEMENGEKFFYVKKMRSKQTLSQGIPS